jgi:tetratricopeptide (TPR) repeat protein
MERFNRAISQILQGKEFVDLEAINAYLEEHLTGKSLGEFVEDGKLDAESFAQDLAYDSLEAETREEALKLAREALEYDPYCVDALMQVALLENRTPKKRVEKILAVIAKVEAHLGEKYFEENRGHFWGLIETRPYMRALEMCVVLLRVEDRVSEAIALCERMLDLNPGDNQGIRDTLLGLYLQTGNLEESRRMFDRYDSGFAVFAWGRVLERFLSGDLKGAGKALSQARKSNRYVSLYLTGQKFVPDAPPDYYSPGAENEAHYFLNQQALAWAEYPEAIVWLCEAIGGR